MTPRKPKRAKALGVTDEEYERLLAAQDGHCALCSNVPKRLKKDGTPYRLHVDHDHATNRVRGLLCWRCNDALPTWVTAEWLARALFYMGGLKPGDYLYVKQQDEARDRATLGTFERAIFGDNKVIR